MAKSKKFDKVGQKYETPAKTDPLRRFYESLLQQRKDSTMALKWCLERGILGPKTAEKAYLQLSMKNLSIK